jgi:hypothetical protein
MPKRNAQGQLIFSQDEYAEVMKTLASKGLTKPCATCGLATWLLNEGPVYLSVGTHKAGKATMVHGHAHLICTTCGTVRFASLVFSGLQPLADKFLAEGDVP